MSKVVVDSAFKDVQIFVHRRLGVIVGSTAEEIIDDVKEAMGQPKKGKRRKQRGGVATDSAPGEAPAIDSGELLASLNADTSRAAIDLYAEATAGTDHAVRLELDMGRPFLTPATLAKEERFARRVGQAVYRGSEEAGKRVKDV